MDQKPRGLGEPMFWKQVLTIAGLQGLSMLLAVLGVYLWAVLGGRSDDVVRSATFATLVIGNLALILTNRSWRLSIVGALRQRKNPTVKWILGGAGTLLVLLLSVPWLREAFNLGPISLTDWAVALIAGFLGVLWFEIYKALGPRR